jgi:hypothetical protein
VFASPTTLYYMPTSHARNSYARTAASTSCALSRAVYLMLGTVALADNRPSAIGLEECPEDACRIAMVDLPSERLMSPTHLIGRCDFRMTSNMAEIYNPISPAERIGIVFWAQLPKRSVGRS